MSLKEYKFPDGSAIGRFEGIKDIIEKNPDKFNVVLMTGLFDIGWHIIGIQDMLMSMAIYDKKFANKILDLALEYNIGVINQMPPEIDGVRFLEDWGTQEGLMMKVDTWRELLKPRLKEMYEAVKNKNCIVMAHSDGNITELYPDLIEIGVDIIDPNQPEVLDLNFIKKEFGKDVVLFGGLGCQSTIPLGSPEDVLKEAKYTLELLGNGGKYILGPSGSIPTEAPIENVVTLIEFCRNLKNTSMK
jgi:uroporphyrinogen decarboxylase